MSDTETQQPETKPNIYADDTRIVPNRFGDMLRVTVAEGKYTLVQDKDGKQFALRYGEPWRDLVGDNLTLALGHAVEEARTALRKCKCIFCDYVVSFDDPDGKDKLADHITTCEKSPLVQLVKQISAIGDEAMTLVRQLADSEGDREAVPELYERANELVRKWDAESETSEGKDR